MNYVKSINLNMAQSFAAYFDRQQHARGPPILFHCSAGIGGSARGGSDLPCQPGDVAGRSAVCVVVDVITEMMNHNDFKDPLAVVREIRRQRYHAVHTPIQLLFVYDFVIRLGQHRRFALLAEND